MPGRFVIDASVVVAWMFDEDEGTRKIGPVLQGAELLASSMWRLEMVNVLLVQERQKKLTPDQVNQFLELLEDWAVDVVPEPAGRTLNAFASIARPHQLSSYDATYLDVSLRLGLPLFTRDNNLRLAAKRMGVALVEEVA